MNDSEAFEFYKNPANQVAAGPAQPLPVRALKSHVPVRFSPETVAMVKALASIDGLTVSSWIRREVERAIQRRLPNPNTGFLYSVTATNMVSGSAETSSRPTVGPDANLNEELSCAV